MKAHTKKTVPIATDWAAQLANAIGGTLENGHPGEGWVTAKEYCAASGLSGSQGARVLHNAAEAGTITAVKRRYKGRIVNFYKLK